MFAGTHAYFSMEETRSCSVNYFCFGAVLIFVGSILLCALGFTIILPFQATKTWHKTICTVVSSDINNTLCACDEQTSGYPGCGDYYPCLQVIVKYNRENMTDKTNNTISNNWHGSPTTTTSSISNQSPAAYSHNGPRIMVNSNYIEKQSVIVKQEKTDTKANNDADSAHITMVGAAVEQEYGSFPADDYEALLYRSWSDIFYAHCSLQECGDQQWNIKETRRFRSKWGRLGKKLTCHVNPADFNVVILNKTSFWSMLHAVLWPSTSLFIGVTLWVGMCCGCWSIKNEEEIPEATVPYYGVL